MGQYKYCDLCKKNIYYKPLMDCISENHKHYYLIRQKNQAVWRDLNRDKINNKARLFRSNNKERLKTLRHERRIKNLERYRAQGRKDEEKAVLFVLNGFGGKCTCCGFDDLSYKIFGDRFLRIDHINGGGSKHIKEIGRGRLYRWLKKQYDLTGKWPEGFRVLDAGCNASMVPGENICVLHGGPKQ